MNLTDKLALLDAAADENGVAHIPCVGTRRHSEIITGHIYYRLLTDDVAEAWREIETGEVCTTIQDKRHLRFNNPTKD